MYVCEFLLGHASFLPVPVCLRECLHLNTSMFRMTLCYIGVYMLPNRKHCCNECQRLGPMCHQFYFHVGVRLSWHRSRNVRREKMVRGWILVGLRHFIRMRRFERKWRILIKWRRKKTAPYWYDIVQYDCASRCNIEKRVSFLIVSSITHFAKQSN